MKKKSLFFSFIGCTFAAFAATTIPDVTVTPGNPVTVNYTTVGDDAIVTVSFSAAGVALGDVAAANVYGDVNMVVPAGAHTLYWPAQAEYVASGSVTATVTVWPTNDPPDYVVFDLTTKRRRFYTSTEALPHGGLANDLYRTDQIVMRRIPAAGVQWNMGSPGSEIGRTPSKSEYNHLVTLTKDFYLAVFEGTQYQTCLITNDLWFTEFTNRICWATRPADHIAFKQIRGHRWKAGDGRSTSANCLVRYAQRIMDEDIDLPTEAQWEYACRAGTTGATWFTENYPDTTGNYESLNPYARYLYNGGSVNGTAYTDMSISTTGGTARVGSYLPNPWGLYDMLGNVHEQVLDGFWGDFVPDKTAVTDPEGCTTNSVYHVLRGGSWRNNGRFCRAACRVSDGKKWDTTNPNGYGYRLAWHFANPSGLTTENSTYGTTNRPFKTPASVTSSVVYMDASEKGKTSLSNIARVDLFEIGDYASDETPITTLPVGCRFLFR